MSTLHLDVETRWFAPTVWESATAVLFPYKRITFCRPDGRPGPGNSGAPSVFAAYGEYDADRLRRSGIHGKFIRLAPVELDIFA